VKDNLEWEFKDDCDVILKKLCKDLKCSSELQDGRAYVDDDYLMIDRSFAMDQTLFVQVQTKSSGELYVVPIWAQVLGIYSPFDVENQDDKEDKASQGSDDSDKDDQDDKEDKASQGSDDGDKDDQDNNVDKDSQDDKLGNNKSVDPEEMALSLFNSPLVPINLVLV